MGKFLLIIGLLSASSANAQTKFLGDALSFILQFRGGATYGEGSLDGINHSSVGTIGKMRSLSVESEFMFPLSVHWAFRETYNQDINMSFNGANPVRGEMYLTIGELGLKLFLPIGAFQPWAGVGTISGFGAFTNPKTRGNDSYLAAFENETHPIWGSYYHAGVDLIFGKMGIRAYFQEDYLKTEKYYNLQTTQGFSMTNKRIAVGIVGIVP